MMLKELKALIILIFFFNAVFLLPVSWFLTARPLLFFGEPARLAEMLPVSPESTPCYGIGLDGSLKGWFDGANCNTLSGWACDSDAFSQKVEVHFYKDGPAGGGGTYVGKATANIATAGQDNTNIAGACGGDGNRRFSFPVPNSLKDGRAHQVFAHVINIPTNPQKNYPLPFWHPGDYMAKRCIPHQITCSPLPSPSPSPSLRPSPSPSPSPSPVAVCTGISPKTPSVQRGQTATFTCTTQIPLKEPVEDFFAGFRVRYKAPNSNDFTQIALKEPVHPDDCEFSNPASCRYRYTYTVPAGAQAGDYLVECRICHPDQTPCTPWGKAK